MLIRSQNKGVLINLSNIDCVYINSRQVPEKQTPEYMIKTHTTDGTVILGTYSEEKKALKVLDEIEDRHDALNLYKNLTDKQKSEYIMNSSMIEIHNDLKATYQVPQDDEIIIREV